MGPTDSDDWSERNASQLQRKRQKIAKQILSAKVNLTKLRHLSIKSGGLLSNDLRIFAWPKLLNTPPNEVKIVDGEEMRASRDFNQVEMDVQRSVRRFPPGLSQTDQKIVKRKLVRVIVNVLMRNPKLFYYQGFHDICVTFLLVGGEAFAITTVESLTSFHLKDYLCATMEPTSKILDLMFPLIGKVNCRLRSVALGGWQCWITVRPQLGHHLVRSRSR